MTEEFEDREKELQDQPVPDSGMGDLPADLQRARGEQSTDHADPDFIPPGANITQGRGIDATPVPLDIQRQARVEELARGGKIASPSRDLSVTTVWDARPMNARDFLTTDTDKINLSNGDPPSNVAEASYIVPGGYTGVWRGFSFTPTNPVVFIPQGDAALDAAFFDSVLTTLFLNNVAVPDYENMQLGQDVNFQLPTFIIGNADEIFTIRITATQDYVNTVGESLFRFTFYGQNLLTRGLPTRFEIATQEGTGSLGATGIRAST